MFGVAGLVVLVLIAGLAAWLLMRGSLPLTQGTLELPGLAAKVTVTRDDHGMPTITAQDELDAWRALGFVEAQDRFTQMDFMRRAAAGELSALVGSAALPLDRERAIFDLRARARRIYLTAPAADRARLEAFTLGVNDGLAHLKVRPWSYFVLRSRPVPWRPEDCILVIYAMGFNLQDPEARRARSLAALKALYPESVVTFLMAPDAQWATPMAGTPASPPPIPGTRTINLAMMSVTASPPATLASGPPVAASGSNNFAVAGRYTQSGLPLLANDMHLPLAVPPVWYRARLQFPALAPPHASVTLTGVFLPGVPALVAGTNGHIAWGLTNSYGDWADLVRVASPTAASHGEAASAGTTTSASIETLRIAVHGAPAESLAVTRTRWGPVIGKAPNGTLLAAHWSLAQPGGVNLDYIRLENADNVADALDIAAHSGIPAQNFIVADSAGHLGWTIAGRIPARRPNCDYSIPESWSDGRCGWTGWLPADAYPRIVDPASGYLVTANNHVDATTDGDLIGDGGYADGARAHQIAGDLVRLIAKGSITPQDMLGVQLDDRAEFLARWRALILQTLRPSTLKYHPERRAFRDAVADWGGHAAVDSTGYRLVRAFREQVAAETFAPILDRLKTRYPGAELPFESQEEGPLWRLVEAEPPNWLNSRFATWNALYLYAVDGVCARLWRPGKGFSDATWGRRNTVRVEQPLAPALGPLGSWLNMPVVELPGDKNMPRVQAPGFGASMRLVTAPAAAAPGILELPGGESGHPLSPWYKDEFMAWARGEPTPLAPGKPKATLELRPWPRSLSASATAQNSVPSVESGG